MLVCIPEVMRDRLVACGAFCRGIEAMQCAALKKMRGRLVHHPRPARLTPQAKRLSVLRLRRRADAHRG